MNKKIKINNKNINYILRSNKRIKNIRLVIYNDNSLVITKPFGLPNFFVNYFLRRKAYQFLIKKGYFKRSKPVKSIIYSKKHYLKYKEEARKLVESKVIKINRYYNFKYNKIAIRNQLTRWGSCSQRGNLNFNYKILFLSENIQDYIIVHELCHLRQLNHSSAFWKLVAFKIPNHVQIRKELKNINKQNLANFSQ